MSVAKLSKMSIVATRWVYTSCVLSRAETDAMVDVAGSNPVSTIQCAPDGRRSARDRRIALCPHLIMPEVGNHTACNPLTKYFDTHGNVPCDLFTFLASSCPTSGAATEDHALVGRTRREELGWLERVISERAKPDSDRAAVGYLRFRRGGHDSCGCAERDG
jgi:hypothetical protein